MLVNIGIALARIKLSSLPNKVFNLIFANRVATTLLKWFISVTSNNRKDLLPSDNSIVVEEPLGILTGNEGHRGARSRDVPSR